MSFIKLYLNDIKDNYKKIIENKDINVILGSPGSGKTKLIEYISNEFNGLYLKVVDFIDVCEIDEIIDKLKNNSLLCLDGFDEYRTNENSKSQALRIFVKKLKDLDKKIDVKIIISCRELDWYGDSDETSLKRYLNKDIEIFKILPLNEEQISEFCDLKNIDDKQQFKDKFLTKGFLQTPQLFNIASTLQEENITNKIELFEKFILKAINEENSEYQKLNLSNENIFKYLGYMAFVFMFSDIKEFNDSVLRDIAMDEYKVDILEQLVKNGKIFLNKIFIHRTIAEFLLGRYANYLTRDEGFNKKVMLNKFKNRYAIYTELRGSFAWLCSISADKTFINVDPYYQLLYGENNHFSIEFKKDILCSIKQYANKNPYFFRVDDYFAKDELKGFYTQELDEFLQIEILKATKLKNHYLHIFDLIIFSNKEKITQKLKQFLFKKTKKDIFPEDFVMHILKLKYTKDEYIELLNCIKNNEIQDENNRIKIEILNRIYPDNFSIDEMIEVLKEFKPTNFWNTCEFLYQTKEENKEELVLKLEKEIMQKYREEYYNNIDNYEKIQKYRCVKEFLSHFYYELVNSYDGNNDKDIYEILKKIKQYYKEYESFEAETYRSKIAKLSEESLQELSNKLFKYYFLYKLKNDNLKHFFISHFKYFFPLKFPEASRVLFDYFKDNFQAFDDNFKDYLFTEIIQYNQYNHDDEFDNILKNFSIENGLKEIYDKAKQPYQHQYRKSKEEKKLDKQIEQQKEKRKQWEDKINDYYLKIDKDSFFNNLDNLKFVSSILYMNEDSQWKFIDRIKEFLKEFIFTDIYDKYMQVNNLLKNIENKQEFNFDKALFISLYLNNDYENIINKLSLERKKYLYLLTLNENIPLNTVTNENFITFANNQDFSREALNDVFKYFGIFDIVQEILKNTDTKILQRVVETSFFTFTKDNLTDSFLKEFHFDLEKDILVKLNNEYSTKLLRIILKIKEKQILEEDELIYLYKKIFDLRNSSKIFLKLNDNDKIFLSYNFINIFDNSDKLAFINGVQSDFHIVASFISSHLIQLLSKSDIEELLKKDISNYWKRNLSSRLYAIDTNEQQKNSNVILLKNFIKNKAFVDESDFFNFIVEEINELRNKIEMNENNEKNLFYNDNCSHKLEEDCRDIFVNLLDNDSYGIIREKHIGDNRTDFECYDKLKDYKVRVECKNDGYANSVNQLAQRVNEQLIEQYLKNKSTKYGIYLVFYFGDSKKSIKELKNKIFQEVPEEWKNSIEIIIIDLRR